MSDPQYQKREVVSSPGLKKDLAAKLQVKVGARASLLDQVVTWRGFRHPGTTPVINYGAPGAWDRNWVGDPMPIYDPNLANPYRIYYAGQDASVNRRIGFAEGTNPYTLIKYVGNPVFDIGTAGQWDDYMVGDPFILHWHVAGESFWLMFYTGRRVSTGNHIGLATSPDGLVWTRHPGNPIISPGATGEWDDDFLDNITVRRVLDDYEMWYEGRNSQGFWGVGKAVSSGGYTSWVKDTDINPIRWQNLQQELYAVTDHHFFRHHGAYVIPYATDYYGTMGGQKILFAVSLDGETLYENQMCLEPEPARTWEDRELHEPKILWTPDYRYLLYYAGQGSGPSPDFVGIGLAYIFLEPEQAPKAPLWVGETINADPNGSSTLRIPTMDFHHKTFYLLSDQDATVGTGTEGLYIQILDFLGNWQTIDTVSVTADTLLGYDTVYRANWMRILFQPHAEATVNAWIEAK